MKRVKQIKDPTAEQERKRFQHTLALFERNIYKYYVAYRLMTEAAARRRATREQVAPAK